MRGRTFKNAFIIADEMQNSSPNQMLMLTTRIGTGSKMVITGDLKQSDKGLESGLYDFIKKFKVYEKRESEKYNNTDINSGIKMVELTTKDIERSPVIVKILEIYSVNDVVSEKKDNVNEDAVVVRNCAEQTCSIPKRVKIDNDAAMIPSDPLS
jgi:hypothetical protein